VKIAERLLGGGDKVKLSVMFRGREMSHPEIGHEVLGKALSKLTEAAGVEKPPGMEGRFLTVILTPAVKKPVTAAKPGEDGDGAETAAVGNGQVAAAPKAAATAPKPAAARAEAATPKPTATRAEAATPKPTAARAEAATPKPTATRAEAPEATPAAATAQEAEKTSG
jgi:translation initiation factor IF-3